MSDLENAGLDYPEPESNAPAPDWSSTFLNADEDIEISEDGTPEAAPGAAGGNEVETLRRQLQEQQERISALTTRSQVAEAMQPLLERMNVPPQGQGQGQAQGQMQQPGESDEEFRKRLDENYLETGLTGAMDEYFARRLRPEVQRLLQNNLYTSRRLAMLDPEKGPLYQKYQQEVDRYVQEMPPQQKLYSSEVYDGAIAAVAARHGDEIINERVAQALEAEKEKLKEELRKELGLASGPKQPVMRPTHSATPTGGQPPAERRPGTRMSVEQLKAKYPQHTKDAFARGIPAHQYFRTLAKKGLLK